MSTEHALLASITVTFNPDPNLLLQQLALLPAESRKVLVDNGTPKAQWRQLHARLAAIRGVEVISLGQNSGLAHALNIGIDHVRTSGDEPFVLLLDQDSLPELGAPLQLLHAYQKLAGTTNARIGAVGPTLLDPTTGLDHGFHVMTDLRWKRRHPRPDAPPIRCASLNGSGTFMRIDTWLLAGGLDDALFIDHVDTDWSFRLQSLGFTLWGVPSAIFHHHMGASSSRLWLFGWRLWPQRSPRRHYYLFRNATRLLKRNYVPTTWKAWVLIKLLLTFVIQTTLFPSRLSQANNMILGVHDGLRSPRARGGFTPGYPRD